MAIPAKYDSITLCPAGCGSRIHAGDMIHRDPELGVYVHEECTPKPSRFDIGPNEIVCGVCWLVKPCRCDE